MVRHLQADHNAPRDIHIMDANNLLLSFEFVAVFLGIALVVNSQVSEVQVQVYISMKSKSLVYDIEM